MNKAGVLVAAAVACAALTAACGASPGTASGVSSGASASSASAGTTASAATTGSRGTAASTAASTGAAGRTATPRPVESQAVTIKALQQGAGVASLVLRVPRTAGPVPTATLAGGQTLQIIVVARSLTHVVGPGLGVDLQVPAGQPRAVDAVSFTPGRYVVTDATTASPLLVLRVS